TASGAKRVRRSGFILKKRFRKVAESLQKARKPRRVSSFVGSETIGWAEHSKNEPLAAPLHAAFVPLSQGSLMLSLGSLIPAEMMASGPLAGVTDPIYSCSSDAICDFLRRDFRDELLP